MSSEENFEDANGNVPNGIVNVAEEDEAKETPVKDVEKIEKDNTADPIQDVKQEEGRLLDLANSIQAQVSQIQKYLTETGQPDPSFDGQAKATDFRGIDDIRSDALEKITELQDLLYTPHEMLSTKAATDMLSRHAIDRFNLVQAIPVNGMKTYEELAWATMQPVKTVRRLIRHAMTHRIFYEPRAGHVAHTQASRLLAESKPHRDYWGTITQEVWPAATRAVDAIQKWPGSMDRSESGYVLAQGRTMEQTLVADEKKRARYDSAMAANANDRSHSYDKVAAGYDWAALGDGVVVDCGGGIGNVSKFLAKKFPRLRFVVEDQKEVLANAMVEDPEIKDRIQFLEHDFFQEQPIKDADVYFFRRVLMEWSDTDAVKIVRALKPALKLGAVVQVQDFYVPEPGSCPLWQERKFRNSDMLAFALSNGGQREIEEWRAIFQKAGPGFEFRGMAMVPESDIAFIEAVWRGENVD